MEMTLIQKLARRGEMMSIPALKRELADVVAPQEIDALLIQAADAGMVVLTKWTGVPGMAPVGSLYDGERWYNGYSVRE